MISLICICCPEGCHLQVDPDKDYKVTGNRCPRGETYGREEVLNPTRIVTSTVALTSDDLSRLPVKTSKPVPKASIDQVMEIINAVVLEPPVKTGDVVAQLPGTDAVVVVTRTIKK